MAKEFRIIIGSEGVSSESVDVEKESTGEETSNKLTNKETAFLAGQVASLASSVASECINWAIYDINKNLSLDDDYIGQRNLQVAQTLINKGASIGNSILSGALAGFAAGGATPVGIALAAVGAVVGGATSIASSVRETTQAMEQQDIQLRIMDAQLDYTRQRAGWSTKAASIGEDL